MNASILFSPKRWMKNAGISNFEYIISYDYRDLNESNEEIVLKNRKEVIKTMLHFNSRTFFIAGPVTTTIIFRSSWRRNKWIEKFDEIKKFNYVLFHIDVDNSDVHLKKEYTILNSNFLQDVNDVRLGLKLPVQNSEKD